LLPFAALTLWLGWNDKVKQQTTAAPPLCQIIVITINIYEYATHVFQPMGNHHALLLPGHSRSGHEIANLFRESENSVVSQPAAGKRLY